MVSKSIVSTKLLIPQVRSELVSRTRLIDRLNEGVLHKLTVVSAPAGYGKTTLLSDWASQCPIPVAWLSLDEADNDEDRLLSHLIAALQSIPIGSEIGKTAYALRQSPQPPPVQTIVTVLINEIVEYGHNFALVLDDFHVVSAQAVQDLVASILEYLPRNLHLILSSRAMPQLPLARLRVRNELTELTATDLKFTDEESQEFLQDVMGLRLSEKYIKELEERSEGWAASLQLAAISLRDRKDSERVISQLTGSHRFVLDYLAEEVLFDQRQELQEFLLKTCILGSLTAPLCDVVTGTSSSQTYLEHLETENLFTSVLDPEHRWFRYHGLFADFLLEKLKEAEIKATELHLRAARWYESEGYTFEAINHYLSASAYESAADVIEDVILELMGRGEFATISKWIEKLPEELVRLRSRLAMAQEWADLIRNPAVFWFTTTNRMERLAASLGVQPEEMEIVLSDAALSAEGRNLLCEFAIMLAFVARQDGKLERAITLFDLADQQLSGDAFFMRALGRGGLGSIYIRLGDVKQAEQVFGEAVEASQRAGSVFFQVVCLGFQALMQMYQGRLEKAKRNYHKGIDLLATNLGRSVPLSGQVWVGLADIYREQNDLTTALELVSEGVNRGQLVRDFDALVDGYITLARVKHALGDIEGSLEAIESAKEIASQVQITDFIYEVAGWEARLALMRGDRVLPKQWVDEKGLPSSTTALENANNPFTIENSIYARILLAQRQPEKALKWLDGIFNKTGDSPRKHALIEILGLRAMCYHALGRDQEAMRVLGQALLFGEPESYVRVFVDEGTQMAALLRSAGDQGHSPEYVKRLLASFGTDDADGVSLDPLSVRELEVLALVGQGFTNREIAVELMIGLSTVKTHINHIYDKLGVNNRTQAALRAREIGLV